MTQQIEPQTQTHPNTDEGWRLFIRKHWGAFAAFITAGALALAGAVYVFLWFTGNIQALGLVPSTLNLWSMGDVVTLIIHGIFWELVLIGIPAAIGAIAGWQWWRRIPEQEKQQYHLNRKHSKGRNAGGAISPLLSITFALKIYFDGNWNTAIASFSLDYVVDSMVTILLYTIAIFAIPATIALVWWIRHETKKP
jgi:hypothetical protein